MTSKLEWKMFGPRSFEADTMTLMKTQSDGTKQSLDIRKEDVEELLKAVGAMFGYLVIGEAFKKGTEEMLSRRDR